MAATLPFESPAVLQGLSNKEVQAICQDREGYIWIGTRNGLFRYDGYSLVAYKSNFANPDLLTHNNIYCMAEDSCHRLWIGTQRGLNVLDKRTGRVRKYVDVPFGSIGVSQVLVTTDHRIWLGTERGLYEYREATDDFVSLDSLMTGGGYRSVAVKSLLEDDRGDIWIGTWNRGLYRYERKSDTYVQYPPMNPRNSAHVVFQDSQKNIWVGTWGCGLQLLHDAYDPSRTSWTTFRANHQVEGSLADDLIYALAEDVKNHTLWVGTRNALSVVSLITPPYLYNPDYQPITADFCNYSVLDDDCSIASGEVAALLCDRQGIMWIGMIGGGVQLVNPHKARFSLDRLSQVKRMSGSSSVRSMTVDNQGKLWLGTGTDGFGILDRRSGHFTYYKQWDEFVACRPLSSVMCIMQSPSTGRMWLGVYDGGIYEIDSSAPVGKRVTHYDGATLQCDECVYGLYEDTDRNLWIAARGGISMRASDGIAMCMDLSQVEGLMTDGIVFVQLIGGNGMDKWAASNTSGILRISGRGNRKEDYQLRAYSEGNGKLTDNHINCVFRDSRGRIWAGTGGSGLNLYKETEDRFVPVHVAWNLPGDAVISMLEDDYGCLWLSTNAGLVKLCLSDDLQQVRVRLYTVSDGLQDNLFNRGAVAKSADGELFFGGHHGYNSFYASHSTVDTFVSPVVLTDVKLFNRSWNDLPWEERQQVSLLAPAFSEELCLDYRHNNFTLEFSALEYASPDRNRYAYKLEGFDTDWQYTDASRHFAYYNNLAPGRYLFRVKASNSAGVWNEVTTDKAIVVLPPPWRTGWAYLGYLLLTLVVGCLIFRMVRNRIRLRAALHLREMEKAKVEELNHVKLQFFTNVTHELLTPLTILSVSVEELKQIAPDFKEQYQVMTSNINRLIRLLRQILEFRKAETGNLKLRVTNGDLAAFLHRGVESFRPLMRKQDIHFQVSCTPDPFHAYFDTDKLDKIMYNLLSNVSKYGRPGEVVNITLEKDEKGWARLGVKDNGPGISPEAQKNLFKRFYEGDYRRFNTTGTGIGLSLVHDLVTLHHGTIVPSLLASVS